MTPLKHIAKLKNTDQRCVVVFMQLPDRPDHALVIATDNLPTRIEQPLMQVVESDEGQRDAVLANTLNRRMMPDGSNMLTALHQMGMLSAHPISNVIMMPVPNMPFPLVDVLHQMGKITHSSLEAQAQAQAQAPVPTPPPAPVQALASTTLNEKYNPYGDTSNLEASEHARALARNFMIEAEMLEGAAAAKRAEAYKHDPSLRPVEVLKEANPDDADALTTNTPVQINNSRSVQRRSTASRTTSRRRSTAKTQKDEG